MVGECLDEFKFGESTFTIGFYNQCSGRLSRGCAQPALPIGPVSLTFELGLEGCFPLHPAPFRNFGGAWRSVFLSDLRRASVPVADFMGLCSGANDRGEA
jgi:hypothetical protein